LGVGEVSGVDGSCLEFCFPEVTRGTVLDGARLVLVPREGRDLTVIDLDVE